MLRVENLDVFHGDALALDDVSLEIGEGAIVAIVGANGAGKTSLIRTIAGMHRPARGRIMLRGENIAGLPSHRVCDLGIGQGLAFSQPNQHDFVRLRTLIEDLPGLLPGLNLNGHNEGEV